MSQKLPVNGFKWVNDISEINKEFIKNYDENNDKGYILEVERITELLNLIKKHGLNHILKRIRN